MSELLYDLNVLKNMVGDNQAFIKKMIDMFIELVPNQIKQLQLAFDKKDFEQVSQIAHSLKPSIDHMGIISLYDVVRDVESLSDSDQSTLSKSVLTLCDTLTLVITQLNSLN